jgi:hypothetical protein
MMLSWIARMPVPKIVKNGHNSALAFQERAACYKADMEARDIQSCP